MTKKLTCQECGQQLSAEDKFCSNCGFKIIADQKKHWIAVHTFLNEEARNIMANTPSSTDRQLFEKYNTEKAELIQQWAGNADFFYCHWIAETEDDILSALEDGGMGQLIITLAHEMPRYASKDSINDQVMGNPF